MKPVVAVAALALLLTLGACSRDTHREVGRVNNDLMGNSIRIDALPDPRLPNVVCHMAQFERSALDRARQGNWFEDPSNSAVTCQRTGPVDLSGVPLGHGGEEIFSERQSLFFKRTALRRIVDLDHRTILYVAHSREVIEGSAKMSISSVLLTPDEVAAVRRGH